MTILDRVLRNLRSGFPSRHVVGRLSPGEGPAEFVSLDEIMSEQLDEFFPGSAQGSVIYKDASKWAVLGPGTAENVLTTKGAAADPVWQAAGGGGGSWEFVETVVINATSNNLDCPFPAGASDIKIELDIESNTNNASLQSRFTKDAFVSVISTTTQRWASRRYRPSASTSADIFTGSNSATKMELCTSMGNVSDEFYQGTVRIYSANVVGRPTFIRHEGVQNNEATFLDQITGYGVYLTEEVVDGMRFFIAGGTTIDATAHIYKLKTS